VADSTDATLNPPAYPATLGAWIAIALYADRPWDVLVVTRAECPLLTIELMDVEVAASLVVKDQGFAAI
jgi:hypothetical protein